MRNIIRILEQADERSLVLLDELGAGTDPEEGAALARAIVQRLLDRGCTVIATTHHGELKVFAHQTPGVMNASVEFDTETLSPTFRLSIGLPGRSNAIAIAERLGMPADVLASARSDAGPDQERVGDLLIDLQRERDQLAASRQAQQAAAAEVDALRDRLRSEWHDLENRRAELLQNARFEAERELAGVQAALRDAARRADNLVRFEQPSADAAVHVTTELAQARALVAEAEAELTRLQARPAPAVAPVTTVSPRSQIVAGDRVTVRGLHQAGEALGAPDDRGELDIQLGPLRMRVKVDQIDRVDQSTGGSQPPRWGVALPPRAASPGLELEVRGQRVEKVLPRVEEYLNSAYMAGLPFVRIIHGKGTGALRRVVREALASNPLVSDFETAEPRAGGDGVTVARLAI
jgi:DNA mismatch repair protein MutS2